MTSKISSHRTRIVLGAIILALCVVILVVHDDVAKFLSMKNLGLNYAAASAWVDANLILAIGLYILAYMTVAASFLPGSSLFVPAAGLLFGFWLGTPVAWIGSLLAASAGYVVARFLASRILPENWPFLETIRGGFMRNGLAAMLALRLAPGLSFAIGNSVPAALSVPYPTFLLGTAIGLVPSRIAFGLAGAGMGSVLDAENARYQSCVASSGAGSDAACPYSISVTSLLTTETVAALVALAILAFLPIFYDLASAARRRTRSLDPET